MDRVLKIATRKSPLAVWQAEFVSLNYNFITLNLTLSWSK